ncbi:hypothetical protein PSPHG_CDS_0150 [Pseudomonas phage Psxphi15]
MGILNWLFGENKVVHTHLKDKKPEPKYDRMVGEPVVSFLDSLERNPKRYRLEVIGKECEYTGVVYHWMGQDGYYKLTDTKNGDTYQAYVHDSKLYTVHNLPFNLNHWELVAIHSAFKDRRMAARTRLERMISSAQTRRRLESDAREKAARLHYANRFKEDV